MMYASGGLRVRSPEDGHALRSGYASCILGIQDDEPGREVRRRPGPCGNPQSVFRGDGLIIPLAIARRVVLAYRMCIVRGVLAPGVRLRDQDIAQALGVSRTPVREAIRRLQDEGLVVAEASRWTKVALSELR
jgi:hypothetical protein